MLTALVRPVSPSLAECELTYLARDPIDVTRATRQNRAYLECLESLGVRLVPVPAAPDLPDAVFVEDTAVVLDELAVLTRPGVAIRQREVESLAPLLARFRPLARLEPPATLDGGDVLHLGRTLYVGASRRTNADGIAQLRALVASHGYRVDRVVFDGCLHLKSAVTAIGEGLLLVNRDWVDPRQFPDCEILAVPPDEPWAANTLQVGETLLVSSAFPRTVNLLERHGLRLQALDISELQKAEAALTCMSLLFEAPAA